MRMKSCCIIVYLDKLILNTEWLWKNRLGFFHESHQVCVYVCVCDCVCMINKKLVVYHTKQSLTSVAIMSPSKHLASQ